MATVRGGIAVLPHVQAFADAVQDATGVSSFGTYVGHDPSPDRALDTFVPVDDPTQGNAVCDFAIANWDRFGLYYIIFRQQIYNPSVAGYWRDMADRGGVTQNHFDHVHASFWETAAATPGPTPSPGGFLMALTDEQQQAMFDRLEYVWSWTGPASDLLKAAAAGDKTAAAEAAKVVDELVARLKS